MTKVIGILGYGGTMGTVLCKLIPEEVSLLLGQRNMFKINRNNVYYQQVDILDEAQMDSFAENASILVNCAGPSMKLLDHAAKAASKAGIPYVDAFGGDILSKRLHKNSLVGCFVLNAGSFPGLTGVLPIEISKKYFDSVDSMIIETENHDNWGKSSAIDLVFSAVNQFGKPNYYYRDHKLVACESQRSELEYINNETIEVAEYLNARSAHFIQKRSEEMDNKALSKIIQNYVITRDEKILEESLIEEKKTSVRNEYFKITCKVTGEGKEEVQEVVKSIHFKTSYLAGALILYHCVQKILTSPSNALTGVMNAYEIVNGEEFLKECEASGAKIEIEITRSEKLEEGDI